MRVLSFSNVSVVCQGRGVAGTPVAAVVEARAGRRVAFNEVREDLNKWTSTVKANRESEVLNLSAQVLACIRC